MKPPSMDALLDRVYEIDPRLTPVDRHQVEALADQLGLTLPKGYARFMERLGEGVFCHWIRIYGPERIAREIEPTREQLQEFALWRGFSQKNAASAIPIGDTLEGDSIVLCAARPRKLFILPRHADRAVKAPRDLLAAMIKLLEPDGLPEIITFYPFTEQEVRTHTISSERGSLSGVRASLLALGRHDCFEDFPATRETLFYYREFYGEVICSEDPDRLTVQIHFAPEARQCIAPVEACLEKLGFMDPEEEPDEETRRELELLVYVSLNYKHLLTDPPRETCFSRQNPTPSQKRLARYILEHHRDELVFNHCPDCERLARTPRAAQCLYCGARWPRPSV